MCNRLASILFVCLTCFTIGSIAQPIEVTPVSLSELKTHILSQSEGKQFTLVNVWATICPPCVKELPDLFQFQIRHEPNWNLILISTDFRESWPLVPSFLGSYGFTPPYFVKGDPDEIFITGLHPEWSGEIPATFIFDQSGQLLTYWTGDKSYEELEDIAQQLTQERNPS